jgi:hypothetical protein
VTLIWYLLYSRKTYKQQLGGFDGERDETGASGPDSRRQPKPDCQEAFLEAKKGNQERIYGKREEERNLLREMNWEGVYNRGIIKKRD